MLYPKKLLYMMNAENNEDPNLMDHASQLKLQLLPLL